MIQNMCIGIEDIDLISWMNPSTNTKVASYKEICSLCCHLWRWLHCVMFSQSFIFLLLYMAWWNCHFLGAHDSLIQSMGEVIHATCDALVKIESIGPWIHDEMFMESIFSEISYEFFELVKHLDFMIEKKQTSTSNDDSKVFPFDQWNFSIQRTVETAWCFLSKQWNKVYLEREKWRGTSCLHWQNDNKWCC